MSSVQPARFAQAQRPGEAPVPVPDRESQVPEDFPEEVPNQQPPEVPTPPAEQQ
ncbi:MAG: hypothetical protein GAK45_00150 [Pseudomonas citronellolis]|nr:MAG: hypothetical protein GAK45_00150 [Pseudomonas citronellolis]